MAPANSPGAQSAANRRVSSVDRYGLQQRVDKVPSSAPMNKEPSNRVSSMERYGLQARVDKEPSSAPVGKEPSSRVSAAERYGSQALPRSSAKKDPDTINLDDPEVIYLDDKNASAAYQTQTRDENEGNAKFVNFTIFILRLSQTSKCLDL